MSDMRTVATFTLRDVSRETAKVFAAAKKFGRVVVKSRTGDSFTIVREGGPKSSKQAKESPAEAFFRRAEERAKRFREMGYIPPKPGEWDEERFNRIIAGEE